MLKMLLYVVATFMETAIGIWIFAKMFPKRNCMQKKHHISEGVWFIIILAGTFNLLRYYLKMNKGQLQVKIFAVVYISVLIAYIINKFVKQIWKKTELNISEVILFSGAILMLSAQYWNSYVSAPAILLGNVGLIFLLFAFYESTLFEAYLWELLYVTNIGLLKMIYVTYAGAFGNQNFEAFLYPPRIHLYSELIYWMVLLIAVAILVYCVPVTRILKKVMRKYRIQLFLVVIFECVVLYVLMNYGRGKISKENLAVTLIIVVAIMICLMVMLVRMLGKAIVVERNLLDVRSEAMESQYQELRDSYDKYRCLIHDEKHMIFYLRECLEKGKLEEGKRFLENYQDNIVNNENSSWTGIVTLDFVLNIKMRKMNEAAIKFDLDSRVESIPMEDADFVVMLANLFDNAIEASCKCESGNRFIELSVQSVNEMFILRMKNTYLSEPNMKNDRFITSKKDKTKHGWGIESVKHIVEKYDGQIAFQHSNNIFEVSIIINQ
ncbi:ATP-binding protein [Blautia schinkii]|nr:ATP-binding protein [Blautia schinkii]